VATMSLDRVSPCAWRAACLSGSHTNDTLKTMPDTSLMKAPALALGLSFPDLYDREGLARLDAAFIDWLKDVNVDAHARLLAARAAPDALAAKDESNLLIEVARHLEDFLAAMFDVVEPAAELRAAHQTLAPLYDCKRLFVQRYVTRAIKPDAAAALDGNQ